MAAQAARDADLAMPTGAWVPPLSAEAQDRPVSAASDAPAPNADAGDPSAKRSFFDRAALKDLLPVPVYPRRTWSELGFLEHFKLVSIWFWGFLFSLASIMTIFQASNYTQPSDVLYRPLAGIVFAVASVLTAREAHIAVCRPQVQGQPAVPFRTLMSKLATWMALCIAALLVASLLASAIFRVVGSG